MTRDSQTPRRHVGFIRRLRPLARVLHAAVTAMVLGIASAVPAAASALERLFAPDKDLWPRWTTHKSDAKATIDHGPWGQLLSTYVRPGPDGVARFGYGRVTPEDRSLLDQYIETLQSIAISTYDRPEQFAYWINFYNALTIRIILDHYPIESIRDIDISPGLFSDGPWEAKLVQVEGEPVSLDDMEHRILRPIWNDPRIHYAVNCASIGCPDLQAEPFTGATMESLLDRAARTYVNHPRGAQVRNDELHVSSIFNWFREDFGGSEAAVIDHLRHYAEPSLAAELAGRTGIDGFDYDWSLNSLR